MANYFHLILDTAAPSIVSLLINGGENNTASATVTLNISLSDADTTGYQMKLWGVAGAANEAAASWVNFEASKQISLPAGDGLKTVFVKVRDDVHNESAASSASITLDTSVPVVTITGPDVARISKMTGKDASTFGFMADVTFEEYKVKVVPSINSLHEAGTQIPQAGGSTNMSGTGTFAADTAINCTIKGADIESASSGDGTKIVKVFVRNATGTWSV